MASEVSVERQFRFHCSCGATTLSGERTVICTRCGASLGIRRVRRHRQRLDSVAYYGSRTLPVRRIERHSQQASPLPAAGALPVLQTIKSKPTLTSIEADLEDQPGDGAHGSVVIFLPMAVIALIVLFWRSCVG